MHRSKYYLTVSGNLRIVAPLPLGKKRGKVAALHTRYVPRGKLVGEAE